VGYVILCLVRPFHNMHLYLLAVACWVFTDSVFDALLVLSFWQSFISLTIIYWNGWGEGSPEDRRVRRRQCLRRAIDWFASFCCIFLEETSTNMWDAYGQDRMRHRVAPAIKTLAARYLTYPTRVRYWIGASCPPYQNEKTGLVRSGIAEIPLARWLTTGGNKQPWMLRSISYP